VEVAQNQPLTIKSPPLSDHKKTNFFGFGHLEVELEEVVDIVVSTGMREIANGKRKWLLGKWSEKIIKYLIKIYFVRCFQRRYQINLKVSGKCSNSEYKRQIDDKMAKEWLPR
jgi:hypothetical protein